MKEVLALKTISSGLVLTNKDVFLVCHSTGNDFFDLPKGTVEEGESPLSACIRETMEETSLDVSNEHLIDLGVFSYNRRKNLHLFLMITENLPSIDKMICTSFFLNPKTNEFLPEADYYKYVRFVDKHHYVTKNLSNVLDKIEKKLSSY